MAKRTTPVERRAFFAQHQAGQSYPEIAAKASVSRECVRYWCRRLRAGEDAQTHIYRPRQGKLNRFDPKIRYVILRLRLQHPHWGPGRIRIHLQTRPSLRRLPLPSVSQIGQYLYQWRGFRRRRSQKLRRPRPSQPSAVHQRWQIDFKIGIRLAAGGRVNLFDVRDPVGAAYIGDYIFGTGERQHRVTVDEVRTVLRQCFANWHTLPDEIQTDGESVLVNSRRDCFPSLFTLWLKGLAIDHVVIQCVTDNGGVERAHRTIADYVISGNQELTPSAFQAVLTQANYELNYLLPSQAAGCDGRPPVQAHPELLQPRRYYAPECELARFDLARVDRYLATLCWYRPVNINGCVNLGIHQQRYSVGRSYTGETMEIHFDPSDRHFVFACMATPAQIIKRLPAKGLTVADLTGLADWPSGPGPQQLALPGFSVKG